MRCIAFAVAIAITAIAPARAQTGMNFYNRCGTGPRAFFAGGQCSSFVAGIADGLSETHAICLPIGDTAQQDLMVVQTYMRNHPERLQERQHRIVTEALVRAFPCGE